MKQFSLDSWIDWQCKLHKSDMDFNLDRITKIADKLDLIKNNAKQIDLSSQENFSICKPPVITFIPGPMSDISSSQIRKVKDV